MYEILSSAELKRKYFKECM